MTCLQAHSLGAKNCLTLIHLGHVLNNTIQDILCRRARMEGKEVLWLPGTDHAGIATQSKVEQKLRKEKVTRHDLGRDKFLEKVWEWKDEHGGIINNQLKRLGCSCDWERERFTMDPEYSKWISKIFVDLFNEGLLYRGKRMVNWCPKSLTALSDEEVIMKPQKSKLYTMRYPIVGEKDKFLEIATTRPETLMGDTGVAVHPEDKRYKDLVGKFVLRPFPEAEIPIVASDHIDIEFGTGVLKVTPAHDKADFEIGMKNGLEIIDVFTPDGKINEHGGPEFEGMDRFEARIKAAEKLKEMGLLVSEEDYENNVGFSERANVPIEPRISMQWFLKYPCKEEAAAAVANGDIKFRPDRWKKTFAHWMDNIQDWCVSRQLWWGHQIPVWYRKEKSEELQNRESLDTDSAGSDLYVGVEPPQDGENWVRDPDVLDTWFSSWLWPFATMSNSEGEESKTLTKFYPTSDLATGADILFFWVARMIMAGFRWKGEVPFKNVFFNSIIRDKQGRKLSKQLGNSPNPLNVMDKFGADAMRFSVLKAAPLGNDVRFIVEKDKDGEETYPQVEEGRNFATKIWNAVRFRQMQGEADTEPGELSIYAIDILKKLDTLETNVASAYEDYRFNEIASLLYEFWWNQYCDWFLEGAKQDFGKDADPAAKAATLQTMDRVLRRFVILLHPFMPHLTEELWEKCGLREDGGPDFLMLTQLPSDSMLDGIDEAQVEAAVKTVSDVYEAVGRTRNLKAEYNLAANRNVKFILDPEGDFTEAAVFAKLAGAGGIKTEAGFEAESGVPVALTPIGKIYMPLDGLIDKDAERTRLSKQKEKAEIELKKVNGKLSNENFVSRAKPEIVQENKDRQAEWKAKVEELKQMIANLG
ncbi:valine--tRNA ligase [bacterium]|nr:valine--tRNA ligase [bacterium]